MQPPPGWVPEPRSLPEHWAQAAYGVASALHPHCLQRGGAFVRVPRPRDGLAFHSPRIVLHVFPGSCSRIRFLSCSASLSLQVALTCPLLGWTCFGSPRLPIFPRPKCLLTGLQLLSKVCWQAWSVVLPERLGFLLPLSHRSRVLCAPACTSGGRL